MCNKSVCIIVCVVVFAALLAREPQEEEAAARTCRSIQDVVKAKSNNESCTHLDLSTAEGHESVWTMHETAQLADALPGMPELQMLSLSGTESCDWGLISSSWFTGSALFG